MSIHTQSLKSLTWYPSNQSSLAGYNNQRTPGESSSWRQRHLVICELQVHLPSPNQPRPANQWAPSLAEDGQGLRVGPSVGVSPMTSATSILPVLIIITSADGACTQVRHGMTVSRRWGGVPRQRSCWPSYWARTAAVQAEEPADEKDHGSWLRSSTSSTFRTTRRILWRLVDCLKAESAGTIPGLRTWCPSTTKILLLRMRRVLELIGSWRR